MRILHVTKKYPRALGGDAVVVSNLRKQQEAAGHTVSVVTSNCNEIKTGDGIYKVGFRDKPERLDHITWRRLLSLLSLLVRMFGIIRRERPDVIHTHSVDMAFFASFAARLYRVPLVHTFHIVTFYDKAHTWFRRSVELVLARAARPRRVTAPNRYDIEQLRAAGVADARVLSNGVDLTFWSKEIPSGKAESDCTFVTMGRLETQKGYEYLIKAAALLTQATEKDFRIIIIGEGSQEQALRSLAEEEGVEDIVVFAGRKPPRAVRRMLAKADVAVFPSLYETTPLTMLEAWAARVPVIVSAVGIMRDMPKQFDAARVVPPGDAGALMHAMLACMSDDGLRQVLAEKGFEEAKKYAWPAIARTAERVYWDTT